MSTAYVKALPILPTSTGELIIFVRTKIYNKMKKKPFSKEIFQNGFFFVVKNL